MKYTNFIIATVFLIALSSCGKESKKTDNSLQRPINKEDTNSYIAGTESISRNPMLDSLQSYFYTFIGLDSAQIISKYGKPDSLKYFRDKLWKESEDTVTHHVYYYDSLTIYTINNMALLAVTIYKDINLSSEKIAIGMKSQDLIFIYGQPDEEAYDDDAADHDYTVMYNLGNEVDEYYYFYFYKNKLIKTAFYPYID